MVKSMSIKDLSIEQLVTFSISPRKVQVYGVLKNKDKFNKLTYKDTKPILSGEETHQMHT